MRLKVINKYKFQAMKPKVRFPLNVETKLWMGMPTALGIFTMLAHIKDTILPDGHEDGKHPTHWRVK